MSSYLEYFVEHKITASIELEGCRRVLWRPLEVDDVEGRPLLDRPVHAPEPGIAAQHLEAGTQAQDHVSLLGSPG